MIGADVERLRALAGQFERSADRLRRQAGQVSNSVKVSAWVGPVALRFRADWDSTHSVSLKATASSLEDAARLLRRNADEQDRASGSATGSSVPIPAVCEVPTDPKAGPFHPPRAQDHLAFAKFAQGQGDLPTGWTEVDPEGLRRLDLSPNDLRTAEGLNASVVTDSKGNYSLIFKGSESNVTDVDWYRENIRSGLFSGTAVSDVGTFFDPVSSTEQAMDLALKLKSSVDPEHLSITGYSLGGRHAATSGIVTGVPTVTFNAAGVTNEDMVYARSAMGGDSVSPLEYFARRVSFGSLADSVETEHITSYVSSGDPLTIAQDLLPIADSVGRRVEISGDGHGLDSFDGTLR